MTTTHAFNVKHGDTIIDVLVDTDDDIADAAIQAAASAEQTLKAKPFIVTHVLTGETLMFSHGDIDEWWA